jgi:hypothetical protein
LVDTRTELLELAVRSGMKVLEAMMEEDRPTLCGARSAHEPDRAASRAGRVASAVVLGGRKVALRRRRVRAEGHEVALPTFQVMAQTDPLNRRVVELARRLEDDYPSAAESVREGLDETLTVLTLHLSDRLRRSLTTTNAIESLMSRTRHIKHNVKRWRSGKVIVRWVAVGILEAVKGFRRLKGCADMPKLVTALRTRDQQIGLVIAEENVA